MLPEKVKLLFKHFGERPKNQAGFNVAREVIKEQGLDIDFYNKYRFLTQSDVANIFNAIKINKNSSFYEFFMRYFELPNGAGEELEGVSEIIRDGYWADEYPEIGKRYLQISSIEGEGSYFYDKETDAVYDVNWGEEADMISGKKQPWFNSFDEFLEWYYNDVDMGN